VERTLEGVKRGFGVSLTCMMMLGLISDNAEAWKYENMVYRHFILSTIQ